MFGIIYAAVIRVWNIIINCGPDKYKDKRLKDKEDIS